MTLIHKPALAGAIAAVALGATALVPFHAPQAHAARTNCFGAYIARGYALAMVEQYGDSMFFLEFEAIEQYMRDNC